MASIDKIFRLGLKLYKILYSNIIDANCNKYAMLLSNIYYIRNKISISCLNKGLGRGQLCIYSCVDTYNNGSSFNIANHSFKVFTIKRIFKDGNDK